MAAKINTHPKYRVLRVFLLVVETGSIPLFPNKYCIFPIDSELCNVTEKISFNVSDELLLNENQITLAVGAQYQLEYLGYGSVASSEIDSVEWTSADTKYAEVDKSSGLVTAKTTSYWSINIWKVGIAKSGVPIKTILNIYIHTRS